MKLTTEQQEKIRLERGICVNEVCDGCHALLGEVRFTRYGQPGEWCSRECRDGIEAAQRWDATRKGGRPRKHADNVERQRSYRQHHANGQDRYETPRQPVENTAI